VTPFRFGSERIFDLMLMLRLWGCGHRPCDVHNPTGGQAGRTQIKPADAMNTSVNVENANPAKATSATARRPATRARSRTRRRTATPDGGANSPMPIARMITSA
jgi:hypothetical protein